MNPADDITDDDSSHPVSLSSLQNHELLQLDADDSHDDNDDQRQKQAATLANEQTTLTPPRYNDQQEKKRNIIMSSDPNGEHGAAPNKKDSKLQPYSICQHANEAKATGNNMKNVIGLEHVNGTESKATLPQNLDTSASTTTTTTMDASTATASTSSFSSLSNSSMAAPPPPVASLHRMSSTPGAFAAGGSLATSTREQRQRLTNPDDDENMHDSTNATVLSRSSSHSPSNIEQSPLDTTSEVLIQATLVTDRDLESSGKPGPLLMAEPLEEKPKLWFQHFWGRVCVLVSCLMALALIVGLTASLVQQQNNNIKNNSNSTQDYWDVIGRFRTTKKQAYYVVVFGSATDCFDYDAPKLTLQCGDSNEESLILLLDDDTNANNDDDENSDAAQNDASSRSTNSSAGNATNAGGRRRMLRLLSSGNVTNLDVSQQSTLNTSCDRTSYTDLQCSFSLDVGNDSKSTEGGRLPSSDSGFGDGIPENTASSNATTDDQLINGTGMMPTVSLKPVFPGSERRLLLACAGKSEADVILHASLDRSDASRCSTPFYADTKAQYFGGAVSTYLTVGQICRDGDAWRLDGSSSKCQAGDSFDADPLRYCHSSKACVASQVCALGDLDCPAFTCDMNIGNMKETTGSSQCVLPVPGNFGDPTSQLRDTVTAEVPFREDVLDETYASLLDPTSTELDMPDPDEILLSKKRLQANFAIGWGSTSTCDDRMGPSAWIDCGADNVVAVLDSNGTDCLRVNASHVYCASQDLQIEVKVLVACGANDVEGLHASAFLEEQLDSSSCSNFFYADSESSIFGGGSANYLSMGRFCKKSSGSGWKLETAVSTCRSGQQFTSSSSDQSFCYSTGVCSTAHTCGNFDENCTDVDHCQALAGDIDMKLDLNDSTCSSNVGENAAVSTVMWPLVNLQLRSGLSFIEGALSVSISAVLQP
ncbi:hypothetical protein MPSEU_000762500 [Mayamaea pseudoterrestris]|nr:hypothetical protein MPSEU_000762500 [Mayamaea pseudoterrestris]